MKTAPHTKSSSGSYLYSIIASLLICGTVQAAPGTITQVPLFLGGSTPPNIFFLTDDSFSMQSEFMTDDLEGQGAMTRAAVENNSADPDDFIHRHGYPGLKRPGYLEGEDCTFEPLDFFNPQGDRYIYILERENPLAVNFCLYSAEEEWRGRDHTFNSLYYNPSRKYEPWNGVDINGEPYADMDATNARINPYDPSEGTINLLTESALLNRTDWLYGARDHYTNSTRWKEWCEDQDIEESDCRGWRYYYYDANGTRQLKWLHELPVNGDNGETNTQTNFANWFSYHRSRDHTAKYALSKVISQISNARIGFSPLDKEEYAIPIAPATATQRQSIFNNIFANTPVGITPLRSSLNKAGQYFEHGTPLYDPDADDATFTLDDWKSPILSEADGGSCQRNATILITDGFDNTKTANIPQLGNTDADGPGIFDGGFFADGDPNVSNTLADIAMHYFERDLSETLPDRVLWTKTEADSIPEGISRPPFMHQHMNTYTIAFGVKGSLDPAIMSPGDPGFAWPNPNLEDNKTYKIDDLWHAAYNGRGSFINAATPERLEGALNESLPDGRDIIGSPAKIAFSDFRLDDNSKVFSSRFSPLDWSGEFRAREIIGTEVISDTVLWDASSELPSASNRNIISSNGTEGIDFQWDELSPDQQEKLGGGDETEGENRLNYLRGDQSREQSTGNGNYRNRATLLGDIVNSGPEYVGKPRFLFPDTALFGATEGNAYYDFWQQNRNRTPVVYVGANDGMLHGFDAETGTEVLAYVPEGVYENLSLLTSPDYTHQYFVDGSPRQFDARFAPRGDGPSAWHTVLTGGLGAGGKGWYALDVTDPDFAGRDADEIVLWEFNDDDDTSSPSDVGYSFSQPVVILTNAEKNGKNRWAVVTGNGYNSESGIAKLFIIFLDADPSDGWQEGPLNDYIEISTGHGGPSFADMNGLSSPYPVDSDGDWIIDRVYAGDAKGHLWAFDLSSRNANQWQVSYSDGGAPQPLFTALNASGEMQPIIARPSAIRHPQVKRHSSNLPNILVYFGTGQYLTIDDPNNTDTQSFYAVWDRGVGGLTRSDLTEQVMTSYNTQTTGDTSVLLEARFTDSTIAVPYQDSEEPGRFGWLLDLDHAEAQTGERVFTPAYIQHEVVYFTTFQPSASSCGFGGSGWFMTLDALNGGPPPQPVIDLNRNNVVDMGDRVLNFGGSASVTSGTRTDGNGGEASFTDRGVTPSAPDSGLPRLTKKWSGPSRQESRLSWRELRP